MSWTPRCQRIRFISPIAESLLQLTPQDSCLSLDFTNTDRILLNPKILMNAVRNELAQSDAPFLSTTVAAKHPVEQFRHFDTHDRQHIFSVTTKEAIVYANFGQLSFLSGRVCVRSTLRRYAMATPASAHCMSRQLVFGDLSCTRFGRETWHPRNHQLSTIRRIISHWSIVCSS